MIKASIQMNIKCDKCGREIEYKGELPGYDLRSFKCMKRMDGWEVGRTNSDKCLCPQCVKSEANV